MQFHFKISDPDPNASTSTANTTTSNPHSTLQPQQPATLIEPKDAQHEIKLQYVFHFHILINLNHYMITFSGTLWQHFQWIVNWI